MDSEKKQITAKGWSTAKLVGVRQTERERHVFKTKSQSLQPARLKTKPSSLFFSTRPPVRCVCLLLRRRNNSTKRLAGNEGMKFWHCCHSRKWIKTLSALKWEDRGPETEARQAPIWKCINVQTVFEWAFPSHAVAGCDYFFFFLGDFAIVFTPNSMNTFYY